MLKHVVHVEPFAVNTIFHLATFHTLPVRPIPRSIHALPIRPYLPGALHPLGTHPRVEDGSRRRHCPHA